MAGGARLSSIRSTVRFRYFLQRTLTLTCLYVYNAVCTDKKVLGLASVPKQTYIYDVAEIKKATGTW